MSSTFLSKKINKMIDYAFEESYNATHKHKIGCVIFDKGILAKSANSNKTHPRLPGLVDKLHAEMRALKYVENVSGAYIVVVRGTKENPLLAKPCNYCLDYIRKAGIKKVIYSTYYGYEILKL